MKEGYIVWNDSTAGCEFFGVYKTEKAALKQLRKVVRTRFGRCPRDEEKMVDFLAEICRTEAEGYGITYFRENDGSE